MGRWTRVFHVFSIFMYSKITFLSSEKTKKKTICLWGYFGIFTWIFCENKRTMEAFWYFHFLFLFLIEKVLACVPHAPASGRRLRHSGGACDTTRCPNLVIHRLLGCSVIPSSTWCGVCGRIIVGLPPVINCLCFFFLFSLLTTKMHNCPLCLFFSFVCWKVVSFWKVNSGKVNYFLMFVSVMENKLENSF
jgi:hypothetical protein